MKKIGLGLLIVFGLLVLAIIINPQINPNHDTPYLALKNEVSAAAPNEAEVVQRVILYGDAGHSTTDPWQASMAAVSKRASISPEKTTIMALGDNIYMEGFPKMEEDQKEWSEDQLESISYLDSQLKVAKESGAALYLVPGNHDWYADEVDGQAQHIAEYAATHNAKVAFRPETNTRQSEVLNLPGVSLVFVDSEWLMHADEPNFKNALTVLEQQLDTIRKQTPENLIVVGAHHPIMTKGQHAGYTTHFVYWFFVKLIYLVFDVDQDIDHPTYLNMINGLNTVFSKFPKVVFAAGHDHSLQVFKMAEGTGPTYQIVSGAGNSNKVSGVWHNEFTRFALSQEGFVELNVTADGRVHFSAFDIHHEDAVAEFWMDL